jgi:hypothetical protein
MPDSDLYFQVYRTPRCQFVKGQSGNPAGKLPGCGNHASGIAEELLDGEVNALAARQRSNQR